MLIVIKRLWLVLFSAPERGPAFWRELKEDSVRNQVNVTLLFKVQEKLYLYMCGFSVVKAWARIQEMNYGLPAQTCSDTLLHGEDQDIA